jgi:hypothetical protein
LKHENGAIIRLYKSAIKQLQRNQLARVYKEKPGQGMTGLYAPMASFWVLQILQFSAIRLKLSGYFFARYAFAR